MHVKNTLRGHGIVGGISMAVGVLSLVASTQILADKFRIIL